MAFLLFLTYLSGSMNNATLNFIIYMFFGIGIFFSVKHYRDHYRNGFLNFGSALGTALLTCMAIGMVGAVYNYLLYKYLAPSLWEQMLAETQEQLLTGGFSEEKVELQSIIMKNYMTPAILALGVFFYSVLLGGVFSLGIAAMLRRQEIPTMPDNL